MSTHKAHCYQHNTTAQERREHGIPCICNEPPSTHTAHCHEYWDRGLECQCIPADVQQALRDGANPEDVM